MADLRFSLKPETVPQVDTPHRRICTPIPVPESIPILQQWYAAEPDAMGGMAPVIWDRADDCSIYDPYGNCWLDWTSGVLAANAGHTRPEVTDAIIKQAGKLQFAYGHPTEIRAKLASRITEITPAGLDRVFLFAGGSETVECAIKLSRMHGRRVGGERKRIIVSFLNAFHGRTLGSQLAGGIAPMKDWIGTLDPTFVQVPFPDGWHCTDLSFDVFESSLASNNIQPEDIAGVIVETFQGGDAAFAPPEYMQQLAAWCRSHQVILTIDEIQAGFGRTGRMFGFEHYGIVPNLATFAKGLSGALPLAAIMGRADLFEGLPPRSMTTTYGGNPVCAAAALANIELIVAEKLAEKAEATGRILQERLASIAVQHRDVVGFHHGRGMVAAMHIVKPGTKVPAPEAAFRIVEHCVRQGLMLFSPVGTGGASIKICPPLTMTHGAILEGAELFANAIEHVKGS